MPKSVSPKPPSEKAIEEKIDAFSFFGVKMQDVWTFSKKFCFDPEKRLF